MSTRLSRVGEFRLIKLIQKNAHTTRGVIKGIGDDTAVLDGSGRDRLLFTTDMLAEGVHFSKRTAPRDVGHKALACSISDIVAMGGLPTFAVISLGLPAGTGLKFVKDIYKGINHLARQCDVGIVGGDTIKTGKIIINVALLGQVKKSALVTRDTAKEGDRIFVTGPLGKSFQSGRHLKFFPRIKESRYLVEKFKPSAMIDISDGLAADLGHILHQSRVGAVIYEDGIPRNPRATLKNALYDGEDFELIFTLSPSKVARWKAVKRHPFKFYQIGEIVDRKKKLQLVDSRGHASRIEAKGYTHF